MAAHPPSRHQLEIAPQETLERHRARQVQLVDVREDYEVRAGMIAGAQHIPMHQLGTRAASLDAERPLIFYCRIGARSAIAAAAFRDAGYDAWSMTGGLEAWAGGGLPLAPDDGVVAGH